MLYVTTMLLLLSSYRHPFQSLCTPGSGKKPWLDLPQRAGIAVAQRGVQAASPTAINHADCRTCQFCLFVRLFSLPPPPSTKADRKIDSIRTAWM